MAEINFFEPRTLMRVVNAPNFGAKTYLRDSFFPRVRTFNTRTIDIDVKGSEDRKVAKFVNPNLRGTYDERGGFKTQTFEPAYIAPYRVCTAENALDRLPGEALYSSMSPAQRMAQIIADDLLELDKQITRKEEAMAAEALFTGKITVTGEGLGAGKVLTFWDESDKPYTELATTWDTATAKPLEDLRTICQDIVRRTGKTPSYIICGRKAVNALLDRLKGDDSAINNRRVMLGQINPHAMQEGVTYIGDLTYPALTILTYEEWHYDDVTQSDVPLVPEDSVLIVCRGAETTRAYASICVTHPTRGILWQEGRRVANSWISMDNPRGRILQLSSAPLMVVHEPHCFHVVKVLGEKD